MLAPTTTTIIIATNKKVPITNQQFVVKLHKNRMPPLNEMNNNKTPKKPIREKESEIKRMRKSATQPSHYRANV